LPQKGNLDEFTSAAGYNRTYASYVLSMHGKKLRVSRKKVVVGDVRKSWGKRGRKKIYTSEVKKLEEFGEIALDEETRQKTEHAKDRGVRSTHLTKHDKL